MHVTAKSLYANVLLRRVTSNISWGIINQVGGKGLFFLVTMYLARVLGTEGYGLFTYAQSIVLFFWIAVDLGVDMYGSGEIAKDKLNASNIINPLITLRIIGGFVAFFTFLLILLFIKHSASQRLLFIGCALYLVTRAISVEWVMRGFEKFKYITIANFATFTTMLLAMIIFVKSKDDLVKASFLWSLCYLLGSIVLLILLYGKLGIKFEPAFNIRNWLLHLRKSIHFTISGGLTALSLFLPIICLGILASADEVGLFSASYGLVRALIFVLFLVPYALYPIFTELYISEKRKFRKLFNIYMLSSILFGLCITLIGFIYAKDIILLIYGGNYYESIAIFKILIWLVFLHSLRSVYGIAIAATGLQKYYTFAATFKVLFFTILFFALSQLFGISYTFSASISLLVAEIGMILILRFIWKLKDEKRQ